MLFRIVEYSLLIALILLIWQSINTDFEGEWVNRNTGDIYTVHKENLILTT
jgi:hypothetical protein